MLTGKTLAATVVLIVLGGSSIQLYRSLSDVSPEKHFQNALAGLASGDLEPVEAAIVCFQKEREWWPHLAMLESALLNRSGRYEEALVRVFPVTTDDPVRELSLLNVGESLYHLNRIGEAQHVFEVVRNDYPANLNCRRWLGAVYYDLGAYDAAIVELNSVIEQDLADYRPHHLLGMIYQDFEADAEAIGHFREALKKGPPADVSASISVELARVLIRDHQYQAVLSLLESEPVISGGAGLLARCYLSLGRIEDARRALSLTEGSGTLDAVGLEVQADLSEHDGDTVDAIRILSELVADYPDRNQLRYRLAILLRQNGMEAEAAAQFAKWEEVKLLTDELVQLNLQAVSDPGDSVVRDRLSEICASLGKERLAEVWRKAADACRFRD